MGSRLIGKLPADTSRIASRGAVLLAFLAMMACATGEKKGGGHESISGGGGGGGGAASAKSHEDSGAAASSHRVTLVNSLSNNPLTSETVNHAKAEQELEHFRAAKDERGIESRIAAARLANKGAGETLTAAKHLAQVMQEKGGAAKTVPDEVRLEIALAAAQGHNFALAEYLLQDLGESKHAVVKAGAYNAMGVIALRDDRVPEAVLYFKEALKAVPGYKPAQLNLGFAALKGGDLGNAKSSLGSMQNDWFVQYAMITVARLSGDDARAGELCERVLKKQPGHIAVLFNCGLYEYQNRHNVAKAKELLTKAGSAKGGENGWGERAFRLIAQIDAEEAEKKHEEAQKKAEKAAAEKAAKQNSEAKKAPAAKGGNAGGGGPEP